MKTIFSFALILILGITAVSAQELALVRDNDLFGYINKSGEYVIQPQFEKADSFSGKLAAAILGVGFGLSQYLESAYPDPPGFDTNLGLRGVTQHLD